MGVVPFWKEDFFSAVHKIFPASSFSTSNNNHLVKCGESVIVNLISLTDNLNPDQLLALQAAYAARDKLLVQLWEDVWLSKPEQVLSRIKSFLGLNKSVHGRQTKITVLDRRQTLAFLNANHLQGFVRAKYNFGLMYKDQLIAAASFSEARPMKDRGVAYRSAELVRFASADGLTIVGGLSKLISYFTSQVTVNDLMTYADRDWSLGKGYVKLGFELTEITGPQFLYVEQTTLVRYFTHRLPKEVIDLQNENMLNLDDLLKQKGFHKLFNTGNLKYHLYLS